MSHCSQYFWAQSQSQIFCVILKQDRVYRSFERTNKQSVILKIKQFGVLHETADDAKESKEFSDVQNDRTLSPVLLGTLKLKHNGNELMNFIQDIS